EAIRLEPNEFTHYGGLGCIFEELERWTEAEATYREALRLDPSFPACYSDVSYTLFPQPRFEEALKVALHRLQIYPSHGECTNSLVLALLALGRTEEARSKFQGILPQNIKTARCYTVQGWLELRYANEEVCRRLFK